MEMISLDETSDDEIQVLSGATDIVHETPSFPVHMLDDKVNRYRAEASQVRLLRKPSVLPNTEAFLKLRCESRKVNTSQFALFKCELFLQRIDGKKLGTCVPMQTRGFHWEEVCCLCVVSMHFWLLTCS